MRKNYRKDLEIAARQMILVRRVDTLARLILRTITRNIKVDHAGIFLFDKEKREYIVKVSKGKEGARIPVGFTKVSKSNPIIRYFTDKTLFPVRQECLLYDDIARQLRTKAVRGNPEALSLLKEIRTELSLYQARAFIPGFYRNNLIGILFLGGKPHGTGFTPEELGFLSVLASDVVMAIQNAWLFEDLNRQLAINKKLFLSTIAALATAIEAKDKYTHGHTERVASYSLRIARSLFPARTPAVAEFEEKLKIAALFHDIGKIGIPESVLNKNGPLTEAERADIQRHPVIGTEILTPIRELEDVIQGVKYHHERYDGKGYPSGIAGAAIPLMAAVIGVADAFDAMTSDRPYRKAMTFASAVEEIMVNRGRQFHPDVVDAFVSAFNGVNPPADSCHLEIKDIVNSPYLSGDIVIPGIAHLAD